MYLNVDARLVVAVGAEDLGFLRRDCRVAFDERGHHSSGGLNSQCEWGDIKKQQPIRLLRFLPSENGCLENGTNVVEW